MLRTNYASNIHLVKCSNYKIKSSNISRKYLFIALEFFLIQVHDLLITL